ncbi:uncharacterized protein CCOS01_16448 [Colletotrichum costaricense]|uniref:Uncharacterized protein n=1 Tax=Colletotrichum costaricense TaxID=1209916 RepID=A0AAI9YFJ1_9PEZI|nr:uncharacterized protein CCOS01_16448 [Colletotrichum costaricense]KAK1506589.1 hypothetical protein CCOS01_16448 [Colletotrichum costaricense]
MKLPTLDKVSESGLLRTIDPVIQVSYAKAGKSTMKGVVIKLTMSKHEFGNSVTLCNPVPRLVNHRPNTTEMIRRYILAAVSNKNVSTILYNVVSTSIEMRKISSNCAKSQGASGRKVIHCLCGNPKVPGAQNSDPRNRSYMVVDLNVNTSRLLAQKTRLRILNCDAETSLLKQVKAIMRSFGNIMIFNGTFQDFLGGFYLKVIPLAIPRSHSIPHVAVAARQS